MAVKAVNDTAGPDGITPTLLVFGTFPRMTRMDPPAPSVFKRAEAIRKATLEVRKLYSNRRVQDALKMRNGPRTSHLKELPLNSKVWIWREKTNKYERGWKGPYKLLSIEGETCSLSYQTAQNFSGPLL